MKKTFQLQVTHPTTHHKKNIEFNDNTLLYLEQNPNTQQWTIHTKKETLSFTFHPVQEDISSDFWIVSSKTPEERLIKYSDRLRYCAEIQGNMYFSNSQTQLATLLFAPILSKIDPMDETMDLGTFTTTTQDISAPLDDLLDSES